MFFDQFLEFFFLLLIYIKKEEGLQQQRTLLKPQRIRCLLNTHGFRSPIHLSGRFGGSLVYLLLSSATNDRTNCSALHHHPTSQCLGFSFLNTHCKQQQLASCISVDTHIYIHICIYMQVKQLAAASAASLNILPTNQPLHCLIEAVQASVRDARVPGDEHSIQRIVSLSRVTFACRASLSICC